jgi:hypothetical protein
MRKLDRKGYIELRENSIKYLKSLENMWHLTHYKNINEAAIKACESLHWIENIGFKLGYLNKETLEYTEVNSENY